MERQPTAAFVLSLLAGLWMLAAGGMMYGMMGMMRDGGNPMIGHGMMRGIGLWLPWFAPIAGIVVLVGAVFLYTRPEQSRTWGWVIIGFSALNLLVGMGGFLAGTLGVIGGAMAVSWGPGSPRTAH